MEETHTLNAFVQFIYRDMPVDEVISTRRILTESASSRTAYSELLSAKSSLPKALFNPSNDVLNRIMQYSTKTAVLMP